MFDKIKPRKTDTLFSTYLRKKKGHKCEYCHRYYPEGKGLEVSHYYTRGKENTRFDEDNCDVLCNYHHRFLGHGDGREEYIEFKKKKLGEEGFKKLKLRAFQYKKRDDKMDLLIINQLIKINA